MSEHIEVEGIELHRDPATGDYLCGYVGTCSRRAELRTKNPVHLGFGYRPERRFGLIWDLAFGYVSGFPISAILWFALTRSLAPERVQRRIKAWELRTGRHDPSLTEIQYGGFVTLADLRARS
jgi:hypothetical protein